MKCLIVLALAAMAQASPIYLADTPEVAAAKAAHFAEVAKAAVAVGAPAYYPYLGYSSYGIPAITPEGFVADTPEVAAAKAAHFAEKAKAAAAAAAPVAPIVSAAPYYAYPYAYPLPTGGYTGPLAIPVVTPEGYLADTPEVAAAKVAHFAEMAKAQAQA
ncbi:cuticle protein 2-like [Homalodisca vitripennis]|nr:cuticle protein 2-like [Homalodisca vitripennis]